MGIQNVDNFLKTKHFQSIHSYVLLFLENIISLYVITGYIR